jgi:putative ABC transport system ATP-binding protein
MLGGNNLDVDEYEQKPPSRASDSSAGSRPPTTVTLGGISLGEQQGTGGRLHHAVGEEGTALSLPSSHDSCGSGGGAAANCGGSGIIGFSPSLQKPCSVATSTSDTHISTTMEAAIAAAASPHTSKQSSTPRQEDSAAQSPAKTARQSEFGDVVLRLQDIEKTYVIEGSKDPVTALRNINLHEDYHGCGGFKPIRQGEFVMIRGPSGGGKTTLLNIIGTLDAPTKGTVELLGAQIHENSTDDALANIRLRHLGFVFQTFNLIATMTAAENVELPMTLADILSNKERRLRSRQLLALVGLRNRVDHLPSELSGGEQQRVTIARSLANNPSVLLLDEPTGDLDTATTIDVMNLLIRINRATRTTCIMVTHNPDLECYADRILYVSDGCFAKEVTNLEPRILSLEDYVRHLNERETQMTTEVVRREL